MMHSPQTPQQIWELRKDLICGCGEGSVGRRNARERGRSWAQQWEREQHQGRRRAESPKKRQLRHYLRFLFLICFWLNTRLWLVTPDFLVLLPWTLNLITLVPKPRTRKPARRHATRPANAACGACQVARRSSSSSTSSAPGHEAGARGSLPAPGPGAGWRSAGHPELTWPGGIPRRSPNDRPRPADEDGSPRWPGGLRGPVWEDSGGVWLGAHPVAGAPDSPADGGSAGGRPTATCREPPGLWRPQAGHPPTGRPQPRAAPTTLPLRRARGQRPTIRDGPAAPGRLPQVAPGRVDGVIDLVVLEQFIVRLPRRTAEWVQCHCPTSLTQAIQLAEDHMVACPGVGEPRINRSLSPSLSPPSLPSLSRPVPAPRSRVQAAPRAPPRSGNGQGDRWPRRGGGEEPTAAPPSSLRQSLAFPSAAGAAVRPGPACWRCGDPGHFQDHCPMMEVGLLVRVPDSPTAAPDQAGQYQIPVSIKGGTYQALVDSGCNQTSIHQSLMQQRALDMSRKVKVRCVHGDVADYPLVPVSIKFRGKTHRMEVAVNSHLKHPLILGTDWPAFTQLLGIVCADVSWQTGRGRGEAAAQAGEALAGPSPPASEGTRAGEGVKPPELDDFPLEQSRDEALKNAFDRVRSVDGQLLQPNVPLSFPYFALIKERLYRVTQDAQSKGVTTQLLVPRSRREMIFQAAHCTPMAGHLGEAKTRERIMARFFWPGIHENVRRWCAACRECQLVNPPATAKAPLRPLPLMEVPFERIGMDLIGPLERSARGHRFALVLVEYATRYPEAVPLRSISAKSVAEALFRLISRVGIPKEILTDQGTAFMSRTIKELYELLGIKSVRTSVYHPQTDGLVERFNRTLKTMVRKFVKEDAIGINGSSPCCSRCGRSHKPPRGFPPSSSCMDASPGGCWTSLRSRGRRGHQTAVAKFSMSWTSEQNSTPWGGSLGRICCRHRTDKRGCTTGVRGCVNSRREIRYLYYFRRLAQSYSQSGKGPLWSHGEWGSSITRLNERIGVMPVRFITSTC